eukprot:2951048-Pleurochrysis_carterae.AAC.1
MQRELIRGGNALVEAKDNHREEKSKVRNAKKSRWGVKYEGDESGYGAGREKTGERDGAGAGCARASVATVNARPAGRLLKSSLRCLVLTNASVWSLPVLTSDRHALRHVANCRFSTRDNLHRDLDLAAGRPAVLAHTQSLGY